MIRAARLLAVVAPALGLAALWATSHQTYQQGTEWEVPIQGYDPRDYLRGHYVEFTYDWPGFEARDTIPSNICLEGKAPVIEQVTAYFDNPDCAHPVAAGSSNVYGSNSLFRGRLYIGQERARGLEEQLRNRGQRGIVTIRQREDGSFTPISIRFRPLTPAEVNFRNASEGRPFVPLPPTSPRPTENPPPSPQSAP